MRKRNVRITVMFMKPSESGLWYDENGSEHDMVSGPCSCGDWHEVTYATTETPTMDGQPLKEGTKNDQGKPLWSLLPGESVEEIVKVLTYGANKYGAYNWAKGISYSRVFSAAMRHLWAWWRGEDKDAETNISHLGHAGCCLVFLLAYELRGMKAWDDRERRTGGDKCGKLGGESDGLSSVR